MPFQVDPMLIPMFGRGNLSKKFSTGGKVLQGIANAAKIAQEAVSKKTREFPGVLAPQADPVRCQTGRELVKMQRKELSDEQMELL